MPINLPGQPGPKKVSPLLWVAGGVIILVFLMKKNAGSSAAAPIINYPMPAQDSSSSEFAKITADSANQIASLNAGNALESKRIASSEKIALASSPAGLKSCVPWGRWFSMSTGQIAQINAQVAQGKVILTPSGEGMCIVPTGIGIRGSEPPVTSKQKVGLFGSSQQTTGPAGSYQPYGGAVPKPAIVDIYSSAADAASKLATSDASGVILGGY